MRRTLVVLAVLALPCVARATVPNEISGYVTAVLPSGNFDLQGIHVALAPDAQLCTRETAGTATCAPFNPAAAPVFFIGQMLDVDGHMDHVAHILTANKVTLLPNSPATVSGTAIIDFVPSTQPSDLKQRIVRADGYLLHITTATKLNLAPEIKSLAQVSTNQWIEYSGVQQPDGNVLVDYAGIGTNNVSHTEDSLRKKTEYDPSKVPDDAHQSGLSKAFVGVDYKRVPPWHDDAMQARVERIGNSLIPAYQRALPFGDPAKIAFRFQVIDEQSLRDAVKMPNGVILIPHQVVERLLNDDQLAAVLAGGIAECLEKEALRHRTAATLEKVGSATTKSSIVLLYPTGLAGGLLTEHVASAALERALQQSGRVSLCLLHDAGYNIDQAPLAWWLLAGKPGKPLDQTKIPPRAATLYIMLGTTWHTAASGETTAASPGTSTVPAPPKN
ncbi:MAG TPA: hypothetical protein VN612_11860 [Acidobacteriaceae bacterium]|nr:hypothetical protein [Acidobacteriaceae bacterium]